jgi:hypothetical protein
MKSKLFSFTPTEQYIIDKLSNGTSTPKQLSLDYVRDFPNSPRQSIYKSITSLKSREVITGDRTGVVLSNAWLDKLQEFISTTRDIPDHVLELSQGEYLSYMFPNFDVCDTFFHHHTRLMHKRTPRTIPLITHNPHHWFLVTRKQQERELWQDLAREGVLCMISVPATTRVDSQIGSYFMSLDPLLKYSPATALTKNTQYVVVIGDFIYITTIEQWRADAIDAWYQTYTTITPENTQELSEIINKRGRIKVKILRNKKKATEWRKKIGKYFLIPKGYEL